MKLNPLMLLPLSLLITVNSSPVRADDGDSVVACPELAALTRSVQELVSELRASSERESRHQDLLIAIQYLQFRSRSIETLEEEVRSSEDRLARSLDSSNNAASEIEALEDELTNLGEEEADQMRSSIERNRRRLKSRDDGIDRLEQKILDLENQIIESRRQLLTLEDYVIENLDLEP